MSLLHRSADGHLEYQPTVFTLLFFHIGWETDKDTIRNLDNVQEILLLTEIIRYHNPRQLSYAHHT